MVNSCNYSSINSVKTGALPAVGGRSNTGVRHRSSDDPSSYKFIIKYGFSGMETRAASYKFNSI